MYVWLYTSVYFDLKLPWIFGIKSKIDYGLHNDSYCFFHKIPDFIVYEQINKVYLLLNNIFTYGNVHWKDYNFLYIKLHFRLEIKFLGVNSSQETIFFPRLFCFWKVRKLNITFGLSPFYGYLPLNWYALYYLFLFSNLMRLLLCYLFNIETKFFYYNRGKSFQKLTS